MQHTSDLFQDDVTKVMDMVRDFRLIPPNTRQSLYRTSSRAASAHGIQSTMVTILMRKNSPFKLDPSLT
jgi:hypothetical protein